MSAWTEIQLGDVFQVKHGWAFKGEFFQSEGELIVVTPGNFYEQGGFRVRDGKEKFYSGKFPQEYLLSKGNVVIAMTEQGPGLLGSPGIIPEDNKFLHNQRIGLITDIDTARIGEKFIYYLFFTSAVRNEIFGSSTGTKVKHTAPKRIYNISVKIPELSAQHKIASILSAYDDLIENNLKRIKLLEEIAQRTYEEWFVKFRVNGEELAIDEATGLPEGWTKASMLEIADFINGFAFKPTDWQSEGTPIIKIKELKNGVGSDTPRYSGDRVPQKLFITSGDILFSWSGSLEVVIWQDEDGWLNQHLFKVVPKEKKSREFVHQALLRSLSEFNNLTTGATMKHIKRKELDFVQVAKPPLPTLQQFENIVGNVQNQILNIAKQNRILKEARDILLPRLMSGEIDVEKLSVAGIASKNTGREVKTIPFYPMKEEKETLVAEATDVYDTKLEKDKWQFKEAVLIAVLTHKFGSEKYPLGRKRYTKLSYLFHRHAADQIARYARKAAGPYNPGTKYGGPEKIAQQNKYIVKHTNGKLEGFIASDHIADAYPYFQNYWSTEYLNWMEQFRYKKNDELELYATVDNAMIELHTKGQQVNVEAIKSIIKSEKEWAAKLEREIFSDANIQSAIFYLPTLYAY